MYNIGLLDCTLRDGGYVNDWKFGYNTITSVVERMSQAKLEFIEVGFLDERQPEDLNRTIQPNTKAFDKLLADVEHGHSKLLAMIDYGTCSLDNIAQCSETVLDGIRVIFKKPKMKQAIDFGKELIKRGYLVFLQMVSITSYSDRDILDFADLVNGISPYAVSMVDTYGLMHKEDMLNYFFLLDHNLKSGISIGYHSHNNFQLAYSNTTEMLKCISCHDLVVDGTAYGMGKSAGNAPLELLAMYMNENYRKSYEIDQILEVIDTNIMRIYRQHYWGYSLLFYIAASNDCHPNYVNYLLEKRTMSIKSINDTLKLIPKENKLNYDRELIEEIYTKIQAKVRYGAKPLESLANALREKDILLIAPGRSINTNKEEIKAYIIEKKPTIISVNFVSEVYKADYVFISNAKRYINVRKALNANHASVIATSNITPIGREFDYVFNYGDLLGQQDLIEDNALLMLLKALLKIDIKRVSLAGFDGFDIDPSKNYCDLSLDLSSSPERLIKVNNLISLSIKDFKNQIKLEFLTPSVYEKI